VLNLCEVSNITLEVEEVVDNVTAKIIECESKLEQVIKSAGASAIPPSYLHASTSVLLTVAQARMCLPKLELPKFKDDLMTWTVFWDAFNSTVHENPDISNIDKSITSTANHAKSKPTVLLQTAQAIASNNCSQLSRPVCILYDNGSQRSYIIENFRTQLKLKPIHKERLHLNTFENLVCSFGRPKKGEAGWVKEAAIPL